jgi:hypothetical protein
VAPIGPPCEFAEHRKVLEQNRQDAYFSFDNTGMYYQNGSLAPEKRRIMNEMGSPFFWSLFFGEAKKSDSPASEKNLSEKYQFTFYFKPKIRRFAA